MYSTHTFLAQSKTPLYSGLVKLSTCILLLMISAGYTGAQNAHPATPPATTKEPMPSFSSGCRPCQQDSIIAYHLDPYFCLRILLIGTEAEAVVPKILFQITIQLGDLERIPFARCLELSQRITSRSRKKLHEAIPSAAEER